LTFFKNFRVDIQKFFKIEHFNLQKHKISEKERSSKKR